MAEITINHVVSGSVTVDGTITGIINSGGGGSTPVLETLNVSVNPAQSQTITPGTGIDGWNEVKVPQAMACVIQNDFVLAMGGSAYDTIASKDYIAVYDSSGHNSTQFTKGSGGSDTLSQLMFTKSNATATVDAANMGNTIFMGIKGCTSLVIKNATGTYSSVCKGWNTLKHVDIESPSIGISSFEDNPLETIILRGTTSIGKQAFYSGNYTITDIYIYTTSGVCTLGRNAFNNLLSATVHVPASLLADYQANSGWAAYTGITWAGDL